MAETRRILSGSEKGDYVSTGGDYKKSKNKLPIWGTKNKRQKRRQELWQNIIRSPYGGRRKEFIMLKQIKLTMKPPVGQTPNVFWAYNLYGALMQKIDPQYADFLHTTGLKPINQYVYTQKNDENLYWTINLIGDEAAEGFLDILMNTDSFTVEHHQTELKIIGREITAEASEMELVQKYLVEDQVKTSVTISTVTPCAFRSNDSYAIIPSPGLIINSAVQKWNAFATEVAINDEEAVRQIIDATKITAYQLKSFQYHLKGVKIPSFYGDTTLSMRGPEPMLRLFNLLMHYLEFSGLGIKCSLGMGGITITERRNKTNV